MQARISVKMDNAAFDDGNQGRAELARILRDLADNLDAGDGPGESATLRDVNGNKVGQLEFSKADAAPDMLETLRKLEARLTATGRAFYVSGKKHDLQTALEGWKADAEQARAILAKFPNL